MSATSPNKAQSGTTKPPKKLLSSVIFAFVLPVAAVITVIAYVASGSGPVSNSETVEKAVAERIQKVGLVEIRDVNRALRTGEEVYKAQCSACHAEGLVGAPKFRDVAAWSPRVKLGFEALLQSALKGKNAMGPQGGGEFNDIEIGRAVAFMANAAGGKLVAPGPASAAATPDAPVAAAEATPPPAAEPVAVAMVATAANATATVAAGAGEALYKQTCQVCHAAGVAGAPKFGDKADWAPRLKMGIDALFASSVKGKNAMPPRGGSTATDADLRAAVEYLAASAQ